MAQWKLRSDWESSDSDWGDWVQSGAIQLINDDTNGTGDWVLDSADTQGKARTGLEDTSQKINGWRFDVEITDGDGSFTDSRYGPGFEVLDEDGNALLHIQFEPNNIVAVDVGAVDNNTSDRVEFTNTWAFDTLYTDVTIIHTGGGSYDITYDGETVTFTAASAPATSVGLQEAGWHVYEGRSQRWAGYIDTVEYRIPDPPASPNNVDATYVADDQVDLSFDADTSGGPINSYDVELSRDGGSWVSPAGGPSSPGSAGTYSYGPSSDAAYGKQVGADSSIQFRARAVNTTGTSSWVTSDTVYTTPVPPATPSVNRPDASTVELTVTWQTDLVGDDGQYFDVYYREDTGSGYGSWTFFDAFTAADANASGTDAKGGSVTATYNVGTTYDGGVALQNDARYQFKVRHFNNSSRGSEYVIADYGNKNNVYFSDGFESGDTSNWDSVNLTDGSGETSGVVQTLDSRFADTSPAEGSYAVEMFDGGHLRKQLGDLSGESDVHVRLWWQAASWEADAVDALRVRWYDGSAWQTLQTDDWAYNQQGWVFVTISVPDSYLSTDARLEVAQEFQGNYSFTAFDSVVVSDNLHEYTKPTAPSGLSTDTTIEDEIGLSWTTNASLMGLGSTNETRNEVRIKATSAGSYTWPASLQGDAYTFTGLSDGERYDMFVRSTYTQDRRGSESSYWLTDSPVVEATTLLPAPTSLSTANVTADSVDLSWTATHDYGDTLVQYKPTSSGSWTTFSTVSRTTEAETLTGLRNGEQYDARVVANTEHTQAEDV